MVGLWACGGPGAVAPGPWVGGSTPCTTRGRRSPHAQRSGRSCGIATRWPGGVANCPGIFASPGGDLRWNYPFPQISQTKRPNTMRLHDGWSMSRSAEINLLSDFRGSCGTSGRATCSSLCSTPLHLRRHGAARCAPQRSTQQIFRGGGRHARKSRVISSPLRRQMWECDRRPGARDTE